MKLTFTFLFLIILTVGYSQEFKGLKEALSNPESIENLKIEEENLKSLPQELKKCKLLKRLKISGGNIQELPDWISEFVRLEEIELAFVNFKNINNDLLKISKQTNLKSLIIMENSTLKRLPHSFKGLKKLERLTLSMTTKELNNPETFQIISELINLKYLDLEGNFWEKFSEDLKPLKKLKNIKIIKVGGNCMDDKYYIKLKESFKHVSLENEANC